MKPVSETQSGHPKLEFVLIDQAGAWFNCCALGKQALAKSLVNGSQVVLFFLSGRSGMNDQPGTAFLFRDSTVVMTGKTESIPAKRVHLDIQ